MSLMQMINDNEKLQISSLISFSLYSKEFDTNVASRFTHNHNLSTSSTGYQTRVLGVCIPYLYKEIPINRNMELIVFP